MEHGVVAELVDVSDGGDGPRAEDLGDDISKGALHARGDQLGSGVPVSRPRDSRSLTVVVSLCLLSASAVWGPEGPGGDRPALPGVQLSESWSQGDRGPRMCGPWCLGRSSHPRHVGGVRKERHEIFLLHLAPSWGLFS